MKNILLFIIISLIVTGCASTSQYVNFVHPDESNEELATIYVLRPTSKAPATRSKIYQEDTLIGELGPKSYLAWTIKPEGEGIIFRSISESTDIVVINPEPGKTYFIRQRMTMGTWRARPVLDLIDETYGRKLLNGLKPADKMM